jgi:hypothetical protein
MNPPESERVPSVTPPVDIRFGIPLGAKRFYLAINAGRERRGRERREVERIAHPLLKPWNLLFFIACLTMLYTVGLLGILIYSSILDF